MGLLHKFFRLAAAVIASVCLATAANATIQYNSNNNTTGFDATTSQPLWTSITGTWAAVAPGSSAYLLPSHIHGWTDTGRTNGTIAVLSGITALTDGSFVGTQYATWSTSSAVSDDYLGLNANSTVTQGYLAGVIANGTCGMQVVIYRRITSGFTQIATSSGSFATISGCGSLVQTQISTRIAKVGSTIYAKAWVGPANAEPSGWSNTTYVASYTDSSPLAAGYPWTYTSAVPSNIYGPYLTDLAVDDTPYGETNSIAVTTPATISSPPFTITGLYQGTAPTGLNYALDGATSFTAAASPTISGGTFSFALPSGITSNYHQISVQASNATTETSTTGAALIGAAPLSVGTITTSSNNTNVRVTISAAASGGSGSGYCYNIWRGSDPNFTVGSGNQIATCETSLTYIDTPPASANPYYYAVQAQDGAGNTVYALPGGTSSVNAPTYTGPLYTAAQLTGTDLLVLFKGDSRTYCTYCSSGGGTVTSSTPPYYALQYLQSTYGLRVASGFNAGCNGATAANWVPSAAVDSTCPVGSNLYTWAKTNFQTLLSADSSAVCAIQYMLGANDANGGETASQFAGYVQAAVAQDLIDFPSCKVIIHLESYFTGTIYGGGPATQSLAYSYRAALISMVAAFGSSQVVIGDTSSWAYFANNGRYLTEYAPQTSYSGAGNATGYWGTGYLHQYSTTSQPGAADLGRLWAQADAQALYAPAGGGVPAIGSPGISIP